MKKKEKKIRTKELLLGFSYVFHIHMYIQVGTAAAANGRDHSFSRLSACIIYGYYGSDKDVLLFTNFQWIRHYCETIVSSHKYPSSPASSAPSKPPPPLSPLSSHPSLLHSVTFANEIAREQAWHVVTSKHGSPKAQKGHKRMQIRNLLNGKSVCIQM